MFISADNPHETDSTFTMYVPFWTLPSLHSPLITVLRNQELPKHPSRKEQYLKPGATPSTTQWREMEAPMSILVCLWHLFTTVICDLMCHEENAGLYSITPACTIQHRYFELNASVYDQDRRLKPNASVCGPIPSFRAKRRRVPPNARLYDPTLTCTAHHLRFEPDAGVYSPTPMCTTHHQRTADDEDLVGTRWDWRRGRPQLFSRRSGYVLQHHLSYNVYSIFSCTKGSL